MAKPVNSADSCPQTKGIILAAPTTGSGKTVLTLGLLRLLRQRGMNVRAAKTGPDYIDPAFHAAASGGFCLNLDSWAMRPATIAGLIADLGDNNALAVVEGVMGLFDGAPRPKDAPPNQQRLDDGSTASLAALTGWPVVLVVDASGQAASAAAVVRGFAAHRADVKVAGVIFNRTAGERHARMLYRAMAEDYPQVPVLGALSRQQTLTVPHRHLGLVQAAEHNNLNAFLDNAAHAVAEGVDVAALLNLAAESRLSPSGPAQPAVCVPPLGQRIAIARDEAFAFIYPALVNGWKAAGAELSYFSPLADETPAKDADAIYLPGGYPELHAARLAANRYFLNSLKLAAGTGVTIYGECGGYMTLGRSLTDADGVMHYMADLLPHQTTFAKRKLHLGYRQMSLQGVGPLGAVGTAYRGHEFHYAVELPLPDGIQPPPPLFRVRDAEDRELAPAGGRISSVMGAFPHLIDLTLANV